MDISDINLLLKRTDLTIPFTDFLKQLVLIYPSIGLIKDYKPILEGYEDANFLIKTNKGRYVLKIFLNERSQQNVHDYAEALQDLEQINVPVISLIPGQQGTLSSIKDHGKSVFFFLTKFFDGASFDKKTPSLADLIKIANYLAKINTLPLKAAEAYDSWGNKNLLKEFKKNGQKIGIEQLKLINPVIEGFRQLSFNQFSQSFIHGDMQKKHVLKNKNNQYCILDFGCMSFGAKVIDLSTYLAWFCLDEKNWKNNKQIINQVVKEYLKINQLNQSELKSLKVLTQASWAAYYLKTSVLIKEGDLSLETRDWYNQSKVMLELSKNWQLDLQGPTL